MASDPYADQSASDSTGAIRAYEQIRALRATGVVTDAGGSRNLPDNEQSQRGLLGGVGPRA